MAVKQEKNPEYYNKLKAIDNFAKVTQKNKKVPSMASVKDKATICKYLEQPLQNREKLIELSNLFEHRNGYYKRFMLYAANLPTYNSMVIPVSTENIETLKEGFNNANALVERLDLKANLPMFTYSILKNGVGYFYEIEDKTGISYKEIPAQWCRVSYVDNGVYRYEVNIRKINAQELEFYPKELTLRKDAADSEGWLQLSNKAFALPFNGNPYATPVFGTLFPSLFDIETNKLSNYDDMKEDKTKMIHCSLPVDDEGDLLMDLDTVKVFLQMLKDNLPANIKATATPFRTEALRVQDSNTHTEKSVMDILTQSAFNEAGISELLFNNKDNSEGLKLSIRKDEMMIYNSVMPLLDNYINYKLSLIDNRFKVKVLRSSYYSQNEDIKNALNVMNLGGSRMYVMALLGFNPMETENLLLLEQQVLNVNDLFTPPASAWNSSMKDREKISPVKEEGRPSKEE